MRCTEQAKITQGFSRIRTRVLRLRYLCGVYPQQAVMGVSSFVMAVSREQWESAPGFDPMVLQFARQLQKMSSINGAHRPLNQ